jgi:hypothetical protein
MSTMAETRSRRPRRRFTDELTQQAVRLVLDEGKSVTAAAPNQCWVSDMTEFVIGEKRQAVSGRDSRPLFAVRRRVGIGA